MTDRELLEKAAKAAGIKIWPCGIKDGLLWHERGKYDNVAWNPLTDDGDALRLAVDMRLEVWSDILCCRVIADGHPFVIVEERGSEPYAATRRAIVRAAAALADTA